MTINRTFKFSECVSIINGLTVLESGCRNIQRHFRLIEVGRFWIYCCYCLVVLVSYAAEETVKRRIMNNRMNRRMAWCGLRVVWSSELDMVAVVKESLEKFISVCLCFLTLSSLPLLLCSPESWSISLNNILFHTHRLYIYISLERCSPPPSSNFRPLLASPLLLGFTSNWRLRLRRLWCFGHQHQHHRHHHHHNHME